MKNKLIIFSAVSLLTLPFTFSCNSLNKECLTIKSNYKDYAIKNTNVDDYKFKPVDKIKEELETVNINGVDTYKFNNIDYDKDYIRGTWPALSHLTKSIKIAIVAENKNSNELRDIAKKLTLHWIYSNYRNINWWNNELGANSYLANLGLFVFDNLGKKGQDAFNGKIRESSLKYRPSLLTHVGANVFDYIDITCRNAAINNDKEEMDIAFNRLKEEIRNDKTEGFQKDGSFFQHGQQVQNVSYGKSVIRVGKTLYNLRGANYNLPEDKIKIISDYILSGLRFSTFKGYTNYSTVSREYSRINNLDTQANGFNDLGYFLEIENYPDKENTYNFIESINKRTNPVKEDTVKYFDMAKMIVCNIGHTQENPDGVYISYKGTAPYLTNTECVNGENRLGLNMSYGTNTCVMDLGNEYFNITPYWDYSYIPGTTSPNFKTNYEHSYDGENIFYYANKVYNDNLYGWKSPEPTAENLYVYNDGLNDENGIVFSMTRSGHHERSRFTVTCFATKDGMALFGSDFEYAPKDSDPKEGDEHYISPNLHTTIDQYITIDPPTGEEITSDKFINHNTDNKGHILYKSLIKDKPLTKIVETDYVRKEDWHRNNPTMNIDNAPFGPKNIATISIDSDTSKIDRYAYIIVPIENENCFELAYNDNCIHAVVLPKINKIAAAFYDKAHLTFDYKGKEYSAKEDFDMQKFAGKGIFKIFDI